MASAQFESDSGGANRRIAELKARDAAEQAKRALKTMPDILEMVAPLTVTVNMKTREMLILDED